MKTHTKKSRGPKLTKLLSIFRTVLVSIVAIAFVTGGLYAQNQQKTVALFSLGYENSAFWNNLEQVTQAAGNDLNLNIQIYVTDGSTGWLARKLEEVTSSANKPDAVLFPSSDRPDSEYLEIIQKNEVPAIVYNTPLNTDQVGMPREKYSYWIGQITPHDVEAGYNLAKKLITDAREQNPNEEILIYAVTGEKGNKAAEDRLTGLKQALNDYSGVRLVNSNYTNWSDQAATDKTAAALENNPGIDVFWSATDQMALAISELLRNRGRTINEDTFVGGIDWMHRALEAVADGELTASVGGHLIEGGWACVLLFDYFNGADFKSESVVMKTPMSVIDESKVEDYLPLFGPDKWGRINFTVYSKARNSYLKNYKFKLETMIVQLR